MTRTLSGTTLNTNEDTAVEIDLRTLVDDLETPDADLIFNVSGAINGSVELLGDGHTARFTPADDYNGPASFDYDVTDTGDNGDSAITSGPVTIDVAVAAINDDPIAVSTTLNTNEDTAVEIDLRSLVEDIETVDDDLIFSVSNAISGTVELLPDGHTARFTPTADYNGPASFDYDVTDTGDGGDGPITISAVTIDVIVGGDNDPPFVESVLGDVNVDEDASDTLVDLFAAFGDLEDADGDLTLLVTGNTNPALFSTLLIDPATGLLTLDYAANANGTATLTVQATDTGGLSVSQTFDVNVAAINDDPMADTTTLNTNEDTAVEIDLRTLVEDLETPDDDLVFNVGNAVNGSVELLPDGHTARFTPADDYNGPASFDYDVTDTGDNGDSAITSGPVTIDVAIAAINDDPIADTTTLNTNEDTAVEIDLRTLVEDLETPDNDLIFNVGNAVNGSVELLPDGHTARFTPAADYNGPATFDYDVTDTGDGADSAITSGPVTIDVAVAPINDDPIAVGTTLNTNEDTAVEIDLRTLVDDTETVDNDLIFNVGNAVNGSVELLPDGHTARFPPTADYNGPASFDYDVTDTGDNGDPAITVGPVTIDVVVEAVNELSVVAVTVNDGDENRSNVRTIAIEFSDDTNIQELIDSGQIVNVIEVLGVTNSPFTEIQLTSDRFMWDDSTNIVTIDLTVDGFGGSEATLLSDDNYDLRIQTEEILNP